MPRALRLFLATAALFAAATGCRGRPPAPGFSVSEDASSDAGSGVTPVDERIGELRSAENRRAADAIREADLTHHDPAIRRAAARALARTARAGDVPRLQRSLADEDPEVVSWCAHGLGTLCRGDAQRTTATVSALVVRAASLPGTGGRAALDPEFAIARALGRCASVDAETTLQAWLSGSRPRAAHAAFGLGDIAAQRKVLAASTQAALLSAAAGDAKRKPLTEALQPFEHLDHLSKATGERLREVAEARLHTAAAARVFAIRALGHAGAQAAPALRRVLLASEHFTSEERAEAARELGRLGAAGGRALGEALVALTDARKARTNTSLAAHGVLLALLDQLRSAEGVPSGALFELARTPAAPGAPPAVQRRTVELRCRAAALLVQGAYDEPLLASCDPDPSGETGQLAKLTVLAHRPLRGARLTLYNTLATSGHLRVRERALELLQSRSEGSDAASLARALEAPDEGLVVRAAAFLSAHPERVSPEATGDVAAALTRALDAADRVTTRAALVDAAGAVQVRSALPTIERACDASHPTLRSHASRALAVLHAPRTTCDDAPPHPAASELGHLVSRPVHLVIETDGPPLTMVLDPALAPVAVTRVVDLARAGFYDGMVVDRVVAGFVVQFGDREPLGGEKRSLETLRCETSPVPLEARDVAMVLNGRDTAEAALFVALTRHPHLDGSHTIVGHASGDWPALARGDTILRVKVLP